MKQATSGTGKGAVVAGVRAGGWRSPFGPVQMGLCIGRVCVPFQHVTVLRPDAGAL